MHSSWSISARRTRAARPGQPSGSAPLPSACSISAGSTARMVPGTTSAISSHQNEVMAVSTRPFSAMGSAMMTSNALTRSDATMRSRPSPAS